MALVTVWKGEYYAKHSMIQEKWRRMLIDGISFQGDEAVLDIGCGDGRLTAEMCKTAGSVQGIDVSEAMIAWALAHHPEAAFRVEDVLQLQEKEAYDWIISSTSLHWVPNHRKALKNIARALKSGGQFRLLFCALDDFFHPILFAQRGSMVAEMWKHYFGTDKTASFSFRAKDYGKWAKEAGLTHFELEDFTTTETFETHTDFVDWIMGWLQGLSHIPEGVHRLYAEEVAFRYLQYPEMVDSSGRIVFSQRLRLLTGQR